MTGGWIYGQTNLKVASERIAVAAIVMVGLIILKGVQNTRKNDAAG